MPNFDCYPKHMADSLKAQDPTWVKTDDCRTIVDYFRLVAMEREGCRFDIHGNHGSNFSVGAVIQFRYQKTKKPCVEAVLVEYVRGAHEDATADTSGHFFLKDIKFLI
jgi:hypothetical protein